MPPSRPKKPASTAAALRSSPRRFAGPPIKPQSRLSDIEQMVKEMQSAVAAGVMGMDKFSEEVRRGAEVVSQVSAQLTQDYSAGADDPRQISRLPMKGCSLSHWRRSKLARHSFSWVKQHSRLPGRCDINPTSCNRPIEPGDVGTAAVSRVSKSKRNAVSGFPDWRRDRYALDTTQVVEVLPLVTHKKHAASGRRCGWWVHLSRSAGAADRPRRALVGKPFTDAHEHLNHSREISRARGRIPSARASRGTSHRNDPARTWRFRGRWRNGSTRRLTLVL